MYFYVMYLVIGLVFLYDYYFFLRERRSCINICVLFNLFIIGLDIWCRIFLVLYLYLGWCFVLVEKILLYL